MSSTHTDQVAAAFEALKEANNAWVQANRRLAAAMRDERMDILSLQARKEEIAALKADADRLLAAAMQKLREAREAMA
jgi:hypothetical protein